ncbi:MAG: 3-phosphoshikimate 1-carboxyvinyltransferase [Acidobacteria bacterium]|nr:3-phosphoshikimate 1-carboxyvinyltransferase [Acidobacteriota bacterium]
MIRVIRRAQSVSGVVQLPGDKSISHRYAMLAALADGSSEIRHFASSLDCRSTLSCLRALGVEVSESRGILTIVGRGLRGLRAPRGILHAGNSGTTMRLLSGILAGQPFETRITGDDSLRTRPMRRVIEPLRLMGATVESQDQGLPPLTIRGGDLSAIRYPLPVASAQVKSCVLLAGLYGDGPTAVAEPLPTRDHTEIALRRLGATVRQDGPWIEVDPWPDLAPSRLDVPGDISSAAFFLVAAAIVPGSQMLMPCVGLNARRRELLNYLEEAGLDVTVEGEFVVAGESRGDLRVSFGERLLTGQLPKIEGARTAALIDEIPVLSVLGSQTAGGLEVSDARELRVKETDRIAALVCNLRAMGAEVEERPDGLVLGGGARLKGADIDTRGDHRIAMAFAVAGLAAEGETRIHDAGCADVSYPGFFDTLAEVTGQPND